MEAKPKVSTEDVGVIAECISEAIKNISADDIAKLLLKKSKGTRTGQEQTGEKTITSRELAQIMSQAHASIFKKITSFIRIKGNSGLESEFRLAKHIAPNGQAYPMYLLTEKGCNIYCDKIANPNNSESVTRKVENLKKVIEEKFHPLEKKINICKRITQGDFLLGGKPRSEYECYCSVFNQFIAGPALEGREITELTREYEKFRKTVISTHIGTRDYDKLEDALSGVAIEAEMQGFIYGFKLVQTLIGCELSLI